MNVCRHRGAEVVTGSGICSTLQCHYHAWTYGLDGTLRAAPRSEADPEFDRDKLGLKPAQVDSWGPLVFVNADASAPPLAETLGELPEIVRRGGLDLDALSSTSACRSRSTPTGRSPSRTTSSATTARSRTRASAR